MVERLYRGKRIDNGEWVYGFYFCMYHDDDREHLHHFIIPLNVPIPKDKPIGEIQVEVDPETVGQYTGLNDKTDKNGKKIFEGDVVATPKYNGVVVYGTGCYCIKHGNNSPAIDIVMNDFDVYIIGNIYDNPELMEGKP